MASQKIKFSVGLFVASGICLAVLSFIWLGVSRYFEEGRNYAIYFNESVQGLSKDSPVKYRGVTIGRVESIRVAPDSMLVQVVLTVESGQVLDDRIVAQLKSVGITGTMFIELDQKKRGITYTSPELSFTSKYPVIASRPSDYEEILQGINDVLKQLKALDLGGVSEKIRFTLDNLNQAFADVHVKEISKTVRSTVDQAEKILKDERWGRVLAALDETGKSLAGVVAKVDKNLDRVDRSLSSIERLVSDEEQDIKAAIRNFELAMEKANLLLDKGSSIMKSTEETLFQIQNPLVETGRSLERASRNLDRLLETISDQPSQLIFSDPPRSRPLEPERQKP